MKIYNTALQLVVLLVTMFLLFTTVFKNEKIGYVDSAKLLNDFKGSAAAKIQFQKKAKIWQSNVDTLTTEIKKLIKDHERSLAIKPESEQKLTKQLIESKQMQLENYQKSVQQSAGEENQKLTQTVVNQINSYLSNYGKTHRYKLILIANPSGTIAYGRAGTDITNEVLEGMNEDYIQKTK